MAVITQIADAVKNALNEREFSQPFTAVRSYAPYYELPEMGTLHVTVVPVEQATELSNRNSTSNTYTVQVGVQRKVDPDNLAEVDELMDLTQEISDFFCLKRLDSYPHAIWVATENDPVFIPEHMHQLRQFTSVLTLTFQATR